MSEPLVDFSKEALIGPVPGVGGLGGGLLATGLPSVSLGKPKTTQPVQPVKPVTPAKPPAATLPPPGPARLQTPQTSAAPAQTAGPTPAPQLTSPQRFTPPPTVQTVAPQTPYSQRRSTAPSAPPLGYTRDAQGKLVQDQAEGAQFNPAAFSPYVPTEQLITPGDFAMDSSNRRVGSNPNAPGYRAFTDRSGMIVGGTPGKLIEDYGPAVLAANELWGRSDGEEPRMIRQDLPEAERANADIRGMFTDYRPPVGSLLPEGPSLDAARSFSQHALPTTLGGYVDEATGRNEAERFKTLFDREAPLKQRLADSAILAGQGYLDSWPNPANPGQDWVQWGSRATRPQAMAAEAATYYPRKYWHSLQNAPKLAPPTTPPVGPAVPPGPVPNPASAAKPATAPRVFESLRGGLNPLRPATPGGPTSLAGRALNTLTSGGSKLLRVADGLALTKAVGDVVNFGNSQARRNVADFNRPEDLSGRFWAPIATGDGSSLMRNDADLARAAQGREAYTRQAIQAGDDAYRSYYGMGPDDKSLGEKALGSFRPRTSLEYNERQRDAFAKGMGPSGDILGGYFGAMDETLDQPMTHTIPQALDQAGAALVGGAANLVGAGDYVNDKSLLDTPMVPMGPGREYLATPYETYMGAGHERFSADSDQDPAWTGRSARRRQMEQALQSSRDPRVQEALQDAGGWSRWWGGR